MRIESFLEKHSKAKFELDSSPYHQRPVRINVDLQLQPAVIQLPILQWKAQGRPIILIEVWVEYWIQRTRR